MCKATMYGAGIKDELREIGRDVASSLGDELKGVAKDKATSFVKEQFGLGFSDELKSAGRDILSGGGGGRRHRGGRCRGGE
jgi:hypothetical protein